MGKIVLMKKKLVKLLNGSLRRLKTDYIDLYQLHWPERSTNYFGKREYSDINERRRKIGVVLKVSSSMH